MRLIIDEKKIQRNKKLANALTIISLTVLGSGLFFAFRPNLLLWSYIALVVGFVLTQFSLFFSSRYARSPRYDEIMSKALETIRGDYSFYVHTTPAPYLLLGPNKFYLLHPVVTPATISYINGKWKEKGRGIMMRVIGQEGLGNPEKEITHQIDALREHLNEKGLPISEQPAIEPLLVILLDKTKLGELENPPLMFVDIKELRRIIRRFDREDPNPPMTEEKLERIKEILG